MLLAQYPTRALDIDGIQGCASLAAAFSAHARDARNLAYRLHAIAERKKEAEEAFAYNSLASEWPQIIEASALFGMKPMERGLLE